MEFSSKLVEQAVDQMNSLPGIGRKTAFRLVMSLLKREEKAIAKFVNAILTLKKEIKQCTNCCNLSDTELCAICMDKNRDSSIVCVVEDMQDVIAIENTKQFQHHYHVLGGVISPMNGISPQDLTIASLLERIQTKDIKEVILALSTTMEGDTTNYYIYKKLKDSNVKITTIARGISIGDEIEYIDEVTLGRSIRNRILFELSH